MAETLEAQLKKYGPSQLPFEQWKQAANEIRFYGQTKEDIFDILGYPVNPDDTPIKVTYKGDQQGYDTRTGNRAKQAVVRSDKASVQTVGEDVYNKGVVAAKGSGLQEHHRRVMDVYAPFFEGLNPKEQKELAEWFVTEGAPLGNVKENLMAMKPADHDRLHQWLKDNYIQSKTGKPLINLRNLSLNERFVPALTFLEQIQPAIDSATMRAAVSGSAADILRFGKRISPILPAGVAAVIDASDVQASVTTPRTNDISQTERDLRGLSGATGLASLFPPVAPIAAPASMVFGGAAEILGARQRRDEEKQQTQKIMDPDYRVQVVEGQLSDTKQLEKERGYDIMGTL